MAIVQSFGSLQVMARPSVHAWADAGADGVSLYGTRQTYAAIYASQPNVRTCIDFLARNIGMLGLHAFRRISDTDRERLTDHDLVRWLGRPNPSRRTYRLIEDLVSDLGIYFNAYWLKVRTTDPETGRPRIGLVRLPPDEMTVQGGILPTGFTWTRNGTAIPFALSEVVHFNGYNPLSPLQGLSLLKTLRRILAEEAAAGEHRESYWRHAGRMDGVIEQTKDAKDWTKLQQGEFREQWQEFSGSGPMVGKTAVLPKGMILKPVSFSARESEYTGARKLTREECAAAFMIPLPLVGILEHATFSNIKEQHKHLYQDCLGPWLEMIQQEIEGQLLTECADQTGVYVEFNIAAKMAGSFEEQASSLAISIGKPWVTVNEGRAKQNLPRDEDPASDEIAAQQGGPAAVAAAPGGRPQATPPRASDDDDDPSLDAVLRKHRTRQQARLLKYPAEHRAAAFQQHAPRFNRELATDLSPLIGADEALVFAAQLNAATFHLLQQEFAA